MKKNIINLLVAVLFTSVAAFAGTNPSISVDGTKTFVVDTKSWKSESLSIKIRDSKGQVIFRDTYTTDINKKFNFENLPNGSYTIFLENEFKSNEQNFEITAEGIILQTEEITSFKPVITVENDHIDLNYLSFSNSTSVSIYSNNENIFATDIKDENPIHKRFNINDLPKGSYTFSVTSGDNTYTKRFKK